MNGISLNRILNTFSIPHSEAAHKHRHAPNTAVGHSSRSKTAVDTVEISAAGRFKAEQADKSGPSDKTIGGQLTDKEKAQVRELQRIDRETRAHEQAHLGAAGGLARGGASYSFAKGPDGRNYAVGGEVSIDTSPVPDDPDATILKAETIRRAAMAPSDPSAQDKAVAAQATKMANQARAEKLKNKDSDEDNGAGKSELEKLFNPTSDFAKALDLVA